MVEKRETELGGRKWEETLFVDCSEMICQATSSGDLSRKLTVITQGTPPTVVHLLFFPPFHVSCLSPPLFYKSGSMEVDQDRNYSLGLYNAVLSLVPT